MAGVIRHMRNPYVRSHRRHHGKSFRKRRSEVTRLCTKRPRFEQLEARQMLNAEPIIELKLDVTQNGQSIVNDQRQFVVEKGDRFDLEVLFDDERPYIFNDFHLGAFTVYADILADNSHAFRPVLSETQIIEISEDLHDATDGSIVLSLNGQTATIPLFGATSTTPSLTHRPAFAIQQAIEGPEGLNLGAGKVTVFELLREPRDKDGTVGSGDPFRYVIRYVADEYEFVDVPDISVDTSGVIKGGGGSPPVGQVHSVPVYSDPVNETLNPAAFAFNLDARSKSLGNRIVYGNIQSGSYTPGADGTVVFDEVGGTGPLESAGLEAVAESVFGRQSQEFDDFMNPISNVEVFSIELEAIAASTNVNFTLDRADDENNEMSAYGIDDALTDDQVLIDVVDSPTQSGDDRFGMLFGTIVDHPGITVTPLSGLQTNESGTSKTFTVALDTLPLADVIIDLSSSLPSEATVSPARLTFSPTNGTTPQTVTVTGVDDSVDDGDSPFTILTAPVVSNDPFYSGLDADDVAGVNIDNDIAGVTLSKTSGLATSEAGGSDSFTIVLNTKPSADVTIAVSSSKPTEATVSPQQVVFTPTNWNLPKTISVSGVDDQIDDDAVSFSIVTHAAVSEDPKYNQLNPSDVTGSNADDDVAGVTLTGTSGLTVDEAGQSPATFTIALNTIPVAPVTLNLSLSDSSEGTLETSSITFTPANGTAPISVRVFGKDDLIDDGNVAFNVITAPLTGDSKYQQINPPDVTITNINDDTAGITVVAPSLRETSESGGSFTFTVQLDTVPTQSVVIPLVSSDTSEGTVSPSSLTFTPGNAMTPQTVTVTGVNDTIVDGDVPFEVRFGPIVTADLKYRLSPQVVSALNVDNDSPPPTLDFGDAPAEYPVRLEDNGARHTTSNLFLGTAPSLESTARVSDAADGDDKDDGVSFMTTLVASNAGASVATMRVNASTSGRLDAWIDFNQDGDWSDAGERIANAIALQGGDNLVSFTIPSGAGVGTTFARMRVSANGGLSPTGAAQGGEVEDYAVTLADGNVGAEASILLTPGESQVRRNGNAVVVTQGGVTRFSSPVNAIESLELQGGSGDDVFTVGNLGDASFPLKLHAGDGSDSLVFDEQGQVVDLIGGQDVYSDFETIHVVGSGVNSIRLDSTTLLNAVDSNGILTLHVDKDDSRDFVGDWRVTGFDIVDNVFFQVLTLGDATLRLAGAGDWTNPLDSLDVNNSGEVTAIDALQILNQLFRRDFMEGSSGLVAANTLAGTFPMRFFDTNADGSLTPLDALRVINLLARLSRPNTEGEATPPVIQANRPAEDSELDTSNVTDLQRSSPTSRTNIVVSATNSQWQHATVAQSPSVETDDEQEDSSLLVDLAIEELMKPNEV
ncbi:MAG: GEVED domain-containing protein [Pirellulaceae bacterium]